MTWPVTAFILDFALRSLFSVTFALSDLCGKKGVVKDNFRGGCMYLNIIYSLTVLSVSA